MTPFWKTKSMTEMTTEEWESLCDGCAWCCLHKIEDDETHEVYVTHVACRLLNLKTCRCSKYLQRLELVDSCLKITPENILEFTWLPETCAYRRVALGQDLPEWHPLITGDPKGPHKAGASMLGRAISEYGVDMDYLEDYIMDTDAE
ncbi:MAG TPA: YcgN family cysteine cluster protein [Bellilinea sp.]|nr:YcgN family cysteine cluster protein [Bellilinea sp.]